MNISMKSSEALLKLSGKKPPQKSKQYVFQSFDSVPKGVSFMEDMSTTKQIPEAGYVIRGVGNCQLNNSLEVLQKIRKHQKVFVNRLDLEDVNLTDANTNRRIVRQLLELLRTDGITQSFPQCFFDAIDSGITDGYIKTQLEGLLLKEVETVYKSDIVSLLLELLQEISEGVSENDPLAKFVEATVTLRKDIVAVKLVRCDFSQSFFNHIVQQLNDCQKLVELDLSETLLVPAELGKALPTMKAQTIVDLLISAIWICLKQC